MIDDGRVGPYPSSIIHYPSSISGYTLIELMLSVVVGTIVLAGAYASYGMVANQYDKISAYADVEERGVATLRFLSRDLRMAGHKELDTQLESAWGRIDDPVVTVDSTTCCDSLSVIYDSDLFTRRRVTYHVEERENPDRNALLMDIETWNGNTWDMDTPDALVVDYVDDFQVEASDNNSKGEPQLVDVELVLRSRSAMQDQFTFTTPSYNPGNSTFSTTDNYYHDSFTVTVNMRNLRE